MDGNIIAFTTITDVEIFVKNSGVYDWEWAGECSIEGFVDWLWANRNEIDSDNYNHELREYILSGDSNPTDYSLKSGVFTL